MYHTVKQVAESLNLNERTVRDWLIAGKLGGQKAGRKWLITTKALEAVLEPAPPQPGGSPERQLARRSKFMDDHQEELIALGRRLRGRLVLPGYAELFEPGILWQGEHGTTNATTSQERSVAQSWGGIDGDQRSHPLFPAFRDHLAGNRCWTILDHIEKAWGGYHIATWRVWRIVDFAVKRCLPSLPPEVVYPAATAVLQGVLRHVLWLSRKAEADPMQEAVRLARCSRVLDAAYPIAMRKVNLSNETGGFRISTPGLVPRELKPAFDAIVSRKRLLPSLTEWRRSVLDYAELVIDWQAALGPDHVLRMALVEGSCEWCPLQPKG